MPEVDPQLRTRLALARGLLTPFLKAGQLESTGLGKTADLARSRLMPRPGDVALAFEPDVVPQLDAAYATLWAKVAVPQPRPKQTELRLSACSVADLREGTEAAAAFPAGMREISLHLRPGPTWLRFSFCEPGDRLGVAFDGLVFLDDHWAWFPKPWRVLAHGA